MNIINNLDKGKYSELSNILLCDAEIKDSNKPYFDSLPGIIIDLNEYCIMSYDENRQVIQANYNIFLTEGFTAFKNMLKHEYNHQCISSIHSSKEIKDFPLNKLLAYYLLTEGLATYVQFKDCENKTKIHDFIFKNLKESVQLFNTLYSYINEYYEIITNSTNYKKIKKLNEKGNYEKANKLIDQDNKKFIPLFEKLFRKLETFYKQDNALLKKYIQQNIESCKGKPYATSLKCYEEMMKPIKDSRITRIKYFIDAGLGSVYLNMCYTMGSKMCETLEENGMDLKQLIKLNPKEFIKAYNSAVSEELRINC